jgi:hypothetical protein
MREHRKRQKRDETSSVTPTRDETSSVTAPCCDETSSVTPPRPPDGDEIRDEIPGPLDYKALRARLVEAAQHHIDPMADVAPIRALLAQGCDLEAREVPELPRPLKNWGAPWLVREILAAREQRLAGHRVDDPPPPRRAPPAIEWDEFVGGYRAGLIEWASSWMLPKQTLRDLHALLRCEARVPIFDPP